MKSDTVKLVCCVLIFLLLVAAVVAWNVAIWSECRADHSWMYCVRLVSR